MDAFDLNWPAASSEGEIPPEEAVESAIEQFFRAMDLQDLALMKRVVAHDADMTHIGTDAGDMWRGWEELRKATREQFEALEYYKAHIRDLTVRISTRSDVAWYAHLLDASIKREGSEEQRWQGARFTGVFEKRAGQWKMVQTHVSLPESA